MSRQILLIIPIVIAATGTPQQYTDPNAVIPPAAGKGTANDPVQEAGVRVVPKPFQTITFKAPKANSAVASVGVRVGSTINYFTLAAGEQYTVDGSSLRNVPLDLTDYWFKGTAADIVEVIGLPNRQ